MPDGHSVTILARGARGVLNCRFGPAHIPLQASRYTSLPSRPRVRILESVVVSDGLEPTCRARDASSPRSGEASHSLTGGDPTAAAPFGSASDPNIPQGVRSNATPVRLIGLFASTGVVCVSRRCGDEPRLPHDVVVMTGRWLRGTVRPNALIRLLWDAVDLEDRGATAGIPGRRCARRS
jgi:hypothetical protein